MPHLIALTGPAGSGKSYCANILVEQHGYTRLRFADPLKKMLSTLLVEAGCPAQYTHEYTDGALKEEASDYLGGLSPRYAMQTLGTEWGRVCMYHNLWVDITIKQARLALSRGKDVVIDDCRFNSEAEAVQSLGGVVILKDKWGEGIPASSHTSEQGISPRHIQWVIGSVDDVSDLEISMSKVVDALPFFEREE